MYADADSHEIEFLEFLSQSYVEYWIQFWIIGDQF
jgi:hypothetical protein